MKHVHIFMRHAFIIFHQLKSRFHTEVTMDLLLFVVAMLAKQSDHYVED